MACSALQVCHLLGVLASPSSSPGAFPPRRGGSEEGCEQKAGTGFLDEWMWSTGLQGGSSTMRLYLGLMCFGSGTRWGKAVKGGWFVLESVCVYERRNTESNCSCFPFSVGCSVSGRWGEAR